MNKKVCAERLQALKDCRKIVVKAGTRLLTDPESVPQLVSGIQALREKGIKVLLVSSGAVGNGMKQLKIEKRPRQLADVQALAAVGQCHLMAKYNEACAKFGFCAAQLLLTADDLRNRERYLNIMNCIDSLWERGILPVINENDSVSISELKFGDNDILSALIATMTRAKLTIILTTESGLRERNADGTLGSRISLVKKINDDLKASAEGTDNKNLSIGGMISKLRAAEMVNAAGEYLWVADGRNPSALKEIVAGQDIGTLFVPSRKIMDSKKRFIRFFSRCSGRVYVDTGAAEAVKNKGKSLLPSGVTAAEGEFKRGDTLEIIDPAGTVIARGLSNFDSKDCRTIIGHKCAEISKILKRDADDEIIHRDNLVIAN
ncbi:MAG: glutamate 5-kinase [Victivallaceae bacterium]|nr:glutamate 5-kinase [Victivallaceae bacterium]MDD3703775.1 glutamate 5-kinase [Victivallaceae bacterium]MDD4317169.1 glutamate 5-kinase [Victivallaceae bacterium]MDD5664073.1 glutamate 5-kinase [Victivallaceae bacterium]NLK82844.1 glutamate 5-kinase [Lentisphaerota bacterium]